MCVTFLSNYFNLFLINIKKIKINNKINKLLNKNYIKKIIKKIKK